MMTVREFAWTHIPDPTSGQYYSFYATASLVIVGDLTMFGYAIQVGDSLAVRIALGVVATLAAALALNVTKRHLLAQDVLLTPAPDWLSEFLNNRLGQQATRIAFLVTTRPDFSAWESRTAKQCMLPHRVVDSVDSSSREADPQLKHPEFVVAAAAHELGHLLTSDSKRFQRAVDFFVAATAISIGMFVLLFLVRPILFPPALGALAIVLTVELALLLNLMRIREYFADAAARNIVGDECMRRFLDDCARRESHLVYPLSYRITHPFFHRRRDTLGRAEELFAYTVGDAVLLGSQLGILSMAYSWGGNALLSVTGPWLWMIILPSTQLFAWWTLARATLAATFVRALTVRRAAGRGAVAGVAMAAFPLLLMWGFITPVAGAEWAGIVSRMWMKAFAWTGMIAVCHVAWAVGGAEIVRYRGPKTLSLGFVGFGIVWLGLLGLGATFLVMIVLLVPVAVLMEHEAVAAVVDVLLGGLVFGMTSAVVAALWYVWMRCVKTMAVSWGSDGVRARPLFVEAEWRVAVPRGVDVKAQKTSKALVGEQEAFQSGPVEKKSTVTLAAMQGTPTAQGRRRNGVGGCMTLMLMPFGYGLMGGIAQGILGRDVLTGVLAGLTAGVIVALMRLMRRGVSR